MDKTYIVAKNISNVQRRLLSDSKNSVIHGKTAIGFFETIRQIYLYDKTKNGKALPKIINNSGAVRVLYEFMTSSGQWGDKTLKCYSVNDASEIYEKMNILRRNSSNYIFESVILKELNELKNAFEKYLDQKELADETKMLLDIIKNAEPTLDLCYVAEEHPYFDESEIKFVKKFCKKEPFALIGEKNEKYLEKAEFFKGFGRVNEIRYCINDILTKKRALGDTTLFYMSDAYEPFIVSELEGFGIPYASVTGRTAVGMNPICYLFDVLEWAEDNFNLNTFQKVLNNPALKIYVRENSDTEKNYTEYTDSDDEIGEIDSEVVLSKTTKNNETTKRSVSAAKLIDLINKQRTDKENKHPYNIGWSSERCREFIRLCEDSGYADEYADRRAVIDYFKNLLDVFEGIDKETLVNVGKLYRKLAAHIKEYTRVKDESEKCCGSLIYSLTAELDLIHNKKPFDEAAEIIRERVGSLRECDTEETGKLTVEKWTGFRLPDRKYNYFIGMSQSDIQGRKTESATISDAQLEKHFSGMGIAAPTIENDTKRKNAEFYMTLSALAKDAVAVFGYPDYDNIELYALNPSPIYTELLGDAKCPEFIYGAPQSGIKAETVVDTAKYADHIRTKAEIPQPDSSNENLHYSASALQTFIHCPRQYAYERIYGFKKIELPQTTEKTWLDAKDKGTFIHAFMEHYMNKYYDCPKVEYDECKKYTLDKCDSVIAEFISEVEDKNPVYNKTSAEHQKNEMIKICGSYLEKLHEDYMGEWEFLSAEASFGENSDKYDYIVTDPISGKAWTFPSIGFIDRIDCKIDYENNNISFRIVDYKTGKRENIVSHIENATQIQQHIYLKAVNAVLVTALKEKLAKRYPEKSEQIRGMSASADEFRYEFLVKSGAESEPIIIKKEDSSRGAEGRLTVALKTMDELGKYPVQHQMGKNAEILRINGGTDEFKPIDKQLNGKLIKKNLRHEKATVKIDCQYCDYQCICEEYNIEKNAAFKELCAQRRDKYNSIIERFNLNCNSYDNLQKDLNSTVEKLIKAETAAKPKQEKIDMLKAKIAELEEQLKGVKKPDFFEMLYGNSQYNAIWDEIINLKK